MVNGGVIGPLALSLPQPSGNDGPNEAAAREPVTDERE